MNPEETTCPGARNGWICMVVMIAILVVTSLMVASWVKGMPWAMVAVP